MSEIKTGGLDQYGAEAFDQQQFGIAGVERVNPLWWQRQLQQRNSTAAISVTATVFSLFQCQMLTVEGVIGAVALVG